MKPRLLDLFCCAGGAGYGYHLAGFEVTGVDIRPQPNYPFRFIQDDAIAYVQAHGREYDAIHASPPCQRHVKGLAAVNAKLGRTMRHADLIAPTREALRETGKPYVIENVEGAPLIDAIRLCGSSFGLPIRRHRRFESNVLLLGLPCRHGWQREPKYWTSYRPNGEVRLSPVVQVYGASGGTKEWRAAMQIDWMTNDELREAIPPAYTEHLGRQLIGAMR